jgi:hypothetical protein
LLDRTLNAHPSIEMLGEMKYLAPDAWIAFNGADANTTLRNLGQHFDSDPSLEARIKSSPVTFRNLLIRLEREEMSRRASLMRELIAEWFCLNTLRARIWGFKEITNNGARQWDCYDLMFPAATWVHVVRHPLDWLFSGARLSGQQLSKETVPSLLKTWIDTVEMSRQRRRTKRYFEIKYEALCANPEGALGPLFADLGETWHDECQYALQRQWGDRSHRAPLTGEIIEAVLATDGLGHLMNECGYSLGDRPPMPKSNQPPSAKLKLLAKGGFKLRGHFYREIGRCWEIDLSDTTIAGELSAVADDIGFWERSPLRLFESGKPLGPPHALHYQIRRDGGGKYSHWQNRLLFSTSDNSNPNRNGQIYSFDLQADFEALK